MGQWMHISDGLVVSTIKRSENGTGNLVRVFNPQGQPVNGRIGWNLPVKSVYRCNILEERLAQVPLEDGGTFRVELAPKQVATFLPED